MGSKTATRDGWTRVRFGDVVKLSTERCTDPLAAGIDRYVGLEHLEPGDLRIRAWGNVADGVTFTNRFRPGQVLFGKRRAYQRKVAVAAFDGICSSDIYVFEPVDDRLLPNLLPFICHTDGFFEHALKTSAGSLSPRTNWTSLADYEFDLPPISDQHRFSEIFRAAYSLVRTYEALATTAETLIESAISDGLNQATLETLRNGTTPTIPRGWDVITIGEMCDRVTYGFTNPMPTTDDGPWMVTAKDIVDGRINYQSTRHTSNDAFSQLLTPKSRPRAGDVLLTKDGTLGRVALVDQEGVCVNQSVAVLQPKAEFGGEFLYWMLRGREMLARLLADADGTAIKHLYITKVAATPCLVPPAAERKRQIAVYAALQRAVDAITQRVTVARQQLRQLLTMM